MEHVRKMPGIDPSQSAPTAGEVRDECLFSPDSRPASSPENEYAVFPGFVDVHVHLREPGFSRKETVLTGTLAAAAGGYTDVCPMPNVSPVPDSAPHLEETLKAARGGVVRVHPYGSLTVGEAGEVVSDLEGMANSVVAFSDDGRGVQDEGVMREAMLRAKALGKVVAAHCEVNGLLRGGCIHEGKYAREHGYPGICSESEWREVERDLELVRDTGCAYHVCHVSTKESVELIRAAKADGVDVTCETAPHYLLLDDSDLRDSGDFKMNPPLRDASDREALIAGVLDGTIDVIATDHAPHTAEEKSRGLRDSLMGVVGLECAFPALYTGLVRTGIVPPERIIRMMTSAPAERFGIVRDPDTNYCVWDLGEEYEIDPDKFLSKGRSTPFRGMKVFGKCKMTVCDGRIVWIDDGFDPSEITKR